MHVVSLVFLSAVLLLWPLQFSIPAIMAAAGSAGSAQEKTAAGDPAPPRDASPSPPAASPSKRAAGDCGHISLPNPPKTGHRLADKDADKEHKVFEQMVTQMANKRRHIMPMFLHFHERLEIEDAEKGVAAVGQMFLPPCEDVQIPS